MSLRVMCGVCVAMLCLVGVEGWWLGSNDPPAPSTQPKTLLRPVTQSSAAQHPADRDRMVATLLGRPLFSPSRRPAAAQDAASVAQRTASLPGLSGVIHSPDLHRAIFQSQGAGKPIVKVVSEGQTIDNWTVQTIGPESVTLIRDGQTVLLTPTFGTVVIQPPPKPAPVSRWVKAAESGVLRARWSNPQLQP
jgi:hypothetical protein